MKKLFFVCSILALGLFACKSGKAKAEDEKANEELIKLEQEAAVLDSIKADIEESTKALEEMINEIE
jgi:hypothetical protein